MIDMLIVEDEPMAAKRLERFARDALGHRAGASAFARSLEEALALAEHLSESAILFLDLNLFGANGFDLLEVDVRSSARAIVVSADSARAVDAFAHGVVDFVAKPFTRARVALAVDRALDGRDPLAAPAAYLGGAHASGRGVVFTPRDEIVALHGADDYVELERSDGRRLLTRKSMRDLAALLGPDFFRIHRSHIVNRAYVEAFRALPGSRYRLALNTGQSLPVGRARAPAVKNWLNI